MPRCHLQASSDHRGWPRNLPREGNSDFPASQRHTASYARRVRFARCPSSVQRLPQSPGVGSKQAVSPPPSPRADHREPLFQPRLPCAATGPRLTCSQARLSARGRQHRSSQTGVVDGLADNCAEDSSSDRRPLPRPLELTTDSCGPLRYGHGHGHGHRHRHSRSRRRKRRGSIRVEGPPHPRSSVFALGRRRLRPTPHPACPAGHGLGSIP